MAYLGKVVGQGLARPVQAEVEASEKFPPPTTKELARFLGVVGCYRGFSTVAAPPADLRSPKVTFPSVRACDDVEGLLCCAPMLGFERLVGYFSCKFNCVL